MRAVRKGFPIPTVAQGTGKVPVLIEDRKLPPRLREVWELAQHGASASEIAKALGLTANTAKAYLAKAKSRAVGPLGEQALTDREREVRDLMLKRLTDPEIAARLGLSARTVEQHAREVRRKLGLRRSRSISRLPAAFTAQERKVGYLLALGLSAREIALRLGISERTVETHTQNVMRKTGLHDRKKLMSVAELLRSGDAKSPSWRGGWPIDGQENHRDSALRGSVAISISGGERLASPAPSLRDKE
jgi:DNA-binding NarL/FixJ family response regulator